MTAKNWDKELAKIDQQLESVSDEQLFPTAAAKTPAERAAVVDKQQRTSTLGVFARLVLATALGAGMLFWPYSARCGAGLALYLAATGVVAGAGIWTAVWSWRHRSVTGHVLSLGLVGWGLVLGAMEVLPRIGYAKPSPAHPTIWMCE